MTAYQKRLAAIFIGIGVVLVLFLLLAKADEELRPQPRRALVAIEADGDGLARVGRVELVSGRRFTLHAVLEAEDWRGRPVYYTTAQRLILEGGEVAVAALREWDRPEEARILWFTVEGASPYIEVSSQEELDRFGFREDFHPDWGQSWTTPGSVLSSAARAVRIRADLPLTEFGTQRYHVRIELYGPTSRIRPQERYRSVGAEALPDDADSISTVVSRLPGALGAPSRLFTLSQIEPRPPVDAELQHRLIGWTAREIAFSQATMLREVLDSLGVDWDGLSWEAVEPGVAGWGEAGELLRVGARVVLSYRDRGDAGVLDGEDLVLDFDRGARLLRLEEVFLGEGLIERSRAEVREQS